MASKAWLRHLNWNNSGGSATPRKILGSTFAVICRNTWKILCSIWQKVAIDTEQIIVIICKYLVIPFYLLLHVWTALLWKKQMLVTFWAEGEKHLPFFSFTSKHFHVQPDFIWDGASSYKTKFHLMWSIFETFSHQRLASPVFAWNVYSLCHDDEPTNV